MDVEPLTFWYLGPRLTMSSARQAVPSSSCAAEIFRSVAKTHGHRVPALTGLPIACFGASTGAAAVLIAAAERFDAVPTVISRSGRPDLAGELRFTTRRWLRDASDAAFGA